MNLPEDGDITILTRRPEAATQKAGGMGDANPDSAVPLIFGRRIAQGGMGAILEAQDCKIGRTIAVKLMLSELNVNEDQKQRFINEAAVLGRLEHPNIVPIHDLGRTSNGELYYTMKLVKGHTLKDILDAIRDGDPETTTHYTLDRLLTIFRKVCDAMSFSHSHGIIHRDLKPENIMVGEFGEVLVMDWGLAKILQGDPSPASPLSMQPTPEQQAALDSCDANFSITLEGDVMGTPQYMSPEQADGRIADMDARSDIFSLGSILYTILTLRPPVTGQTINEILRNVATGKIISPTTFGTKASKDLPKLQPQDPQARKSLPHCPSGRVPAALSAVVMKALTVEREQRYQDVAALNTDIEAYQGGFATQAERAGAWKQFTLLLKRNKAASTGVAAVLLVGTVLGTQAIVEGKRARREAVRANAALSNLVKTAPTFAAQASDLVEQGELDEALEKIGYAVSLEPRNSDYLRLQADLLQATQRLDNAAESYRAVLVLRPDHAGALTNLALCEKLLRDNQGGTELKRSSQGELVAAMIKQGRAVEAAPLNNLLGEDLDSALAPIKARMKPLIAITGPRAGAIRLPDGTFRLVLKSRPVIDLPPLDGLPITEVDLSNTKVSDLTPLKGLRLRRLNIDTTHVSDLSPLVGMPLESLDASTAYGDKRPKIRDLSPLKGMPLTELILISTPITDLSPLRGMTLKRMILSSTPVADLRPLTSMAIEELDISHTEVTDLAPLAGMPLRSLRVANTGIKDLSPLRGMPLRFLSLNKVSVSDLSPLVGMPLEELILWNTKGIDISVLQTLPLKHLILRGRVEDLRPLAECKTLENLEVPSSSTDISFLRTLPNLQRLTDKVNIANRWDRVPTAQEFWRKYDAQQAGNK